MKHLMLFVAIAMTVAGAGSAFSSSPGKPGAVYLFPEDHDPLRMFSESREAKAADELPYRMDGVVSRSASGVSHLLTLATNGAGAVPVVGAFFGLADSAFMARYMAHRPGGLYNNTLTAIDAGRIATGLTVTGLYTAGIFVPGLGVAVLIVSGVNLSLTTLKSVLETGRNGYKVRDLSEVRRSLKELELRDDAGPGPRSVLKRLESAVEAQRLRKKKRVVAYALMTAGTGLALVGHFTLGLLYIPGIVLATTGAVVRLEESYRDWKLIRIQKRAAGRLSEYHELEGRIAGYMKHPGGGDRFLQLKADSAEICEKQEGKDAKEACLRRLDACPGAPDLWNLVADLWEEDLKVIGFIPVGRGSEPGREYDPHLNPVGFAEELAWKIQHPGPDREDYEKICNAVFAGEEINAQDGLEDKEGFIKHMLRYLPGGDNVREYS